MACYNLAEQRRHLRRRDEVTARAEFRRTRRVVAEPRCIQGLLHELRKTDHAAGGVDDNSNVLGYALAVRGALGIG